MNRLFPVDTLKDNDVATVVCKLKKYEKDSYEILKKKSHQESPAKYDFIPIETHQVMNYLRGKNIE